MEYGEWIGRALDAAASVEYQAGAVVSKTLLKKSVGNITLFAFDAGQELSEHTSPFDAFVQVLDGTGTILIRGEPHAVPAGSFIIMPANVPHAVQARERFKMMLVMVRSPQ